jgi:hypothetical protein
LQPAEDGRGQLSQLGGDGAVLGPQDQRAAVDVVDAARGRKRRRDSTPVSPVDLGELDRLAREAAQGIAGAQVFLEFPHQCPAVPARANPELA